VISCCIPAGLVRGLLRGEIDNEEDIDDCIEMSYIFVRVKDGWKNPENQDPIFEEI
jgi:hypothetical protein